MSGPGTESFEVLTRFAAADVTADDAMIMKYRGIGPGREPVFVGAFLIKGGAALHGDQDRLHALVPDDD